MTLAAYKGHEPRLFLDYLDMETGKALYAEPGGTYDMSPVGAGRVIPDVPEQWFTPVQQDSAEVQVEPVDVSEAAEADEEPAEQDCGDSGEQDSSGAF